MAEKPLLIIIHPHFTLPGGAGKYILEIAQRCTDDYEVIAICQQANHNITQQYPGVVFRSINGPLTSSFWFWLLWPIWYCKTAWQLNQLRATSRRVTLFCSVFPAHWFGLLYKRLHRDVRAVWLCPEPSAFIYSDTWKQAITSPLKRFIAKVLSPVLAVIDKSAVRQCDAIIADSKYTQQHILDIYHQTSVVGYPGVKAQNIPLQPIGLRTKRILTVGRLTTFKRVDVLVRAFVLADLFDFRLDIIGTGEAVPQLQQLITELRCSDRVQIRSGISDSDLAQIYADSRVFVLCSKGEPFGLVVVEAMAYGTPVIADASGGPAETVLDHTTGELINLTETTLAKTLQTLAAQTEVLQRYGDAGTVWVKQEFDWQNTVNKVKQYL
ncbi:MAG: Glycosyl transferase, group 1 [uncultured bacterium]|nr:MAG: Glycosyl transferase, group 1 [uncultured bacterium]